MMKSHSKARESCNYVSPHPPQKREEQRDCFTYINEARTNKDWSGIFLVKMADLSAIAIVPNLEIT